jgi:hypothetical protein
MASMITIRPPRVKTESVSWLAICLAFKYCDGAKCWGYVGTSIEPFCVKFFTFVQCYTFVNCFIIIIIIIIIIIKLYI